MQGNNLPPQYHLPPSAITSVVAGAAAAAVAAASHSRSRSPSPSPSPAPSAPSSVGPIPGAFSPYALSSRNYGASLASPSPQRYGTQRKIKIETRPAPAADEYPPVPPPPLPPKARAPPTIRVPPSAPSSPSAAYVSPRPASRDDPFVSAASGSASHWLKPSPDGDDSSSASSRAAVEEVTPISTSPSPSTSVGSYRLPATPRKRKGVKAVRSPRVAGSVSPRITRRDRERERERSVPRSSPRPSLLNTLDYLLIPFRILAWPLKGVISPVIAHILNTALLFALLAVVIYISASKLRSLADAFPLVTEGVLLPVRSIATPTCFLLNIMCPLSLFSEANSTAQPFWRVFSSSKGSVDVAAVSRSLSSEVRVAKDIFDSLLSLGDGRMMEGLAHVRIHELGIAVQTGSTLDDRYFIGQELIQLADTASSVADEVVKINAMSVSIFSWLFWEFSHIVKLLDLPDHSRPSPRTLSSRLDSLVSRLDADLDRLHTRVGAAIPVAERGAQQGWTLHEHLSFIASDLRAEHEKYPTWQRALEAGKKFFAGGDPSKLTRISRDLEITQGTILGITETRNSLERVRIGLVAFRDQVRHFSASVMGLHLGADAAIGLGPEEELAILSTVVGELGVSVGRAKKMPLEAGETRFIEAS